MSPDLRRALDDLRDATAADDPVSIRAAAQRVAHLWDQQSSRPLMEGASL